MDKICRPINTDMIDISQFFFFRWTSPAMNRDEDRSTKDWKIPGWDESWQSHQITIKAKISAYPWNKQQSTWLVGWESQVKPSALHLLELFFSFWQQPFENVTPRCQFFIFPFSKHNNSSAPLRALLSCANGWNAKRSKFGLSLSVRFLPFSNVSLLFFCFGGPVFSINFCVSHVLFHHFFTSALFLLSGYFSNVPNNRE